MSFPFWTALQPQKNVRRKKSPRRYFRPQLDRLEERLLLASVTSVTDSNLAYLTTGQNLWGPGQSQPLRADFNYPLINQPVSFSAGGFRPGLFGGETGARASVSGSVNVGLDGFFEVGAGGANINYESDVSVVAQGVGKPIANVTAGDRVKLHTTGTADPSGISMETSLPSLEAALNLDYGIRANASVLGKIEGAVIVNKTLVNASVTDTQELVGASANLNTGALEVRLLGETIADGSSFDFADPTGIFNGSIYVPSLSTSGADSQWTGTEIVNSNVSNTPASHPSRNDLLRLGIDLDAIVSKVIPLGVGFGGDALAVSGSLIDAGINAYLGVSHTITFQPQQMVDLYFYDANNSPLVVSVETSPGSGIFKGTTHTSVPVGQDIQFIHPGVTVKVDTKHSLAGTLHNNTGIFLAPDFSLSLLNVSASGWLLDAAAAVGVPVSQLDFSAYSNTFPLGSPTPVATLFDSTFPVSGFNTLEGGDLVIESSGLPPTVLVAQATLNDSTITEGETVQATVKLTDPQNGTLYSLSAIWGDGVQQNFTLTGDRQGDPSFDAATRTFNISHTYNAPGSFTPQFHVFNLISTETYTSNAALTVGNVAPVVSIDTYTVTPNGTKGDVLLVGTFTDGGSGDAHTVQVNWGDTECSRYALPATSALTVGQTVGSSTCGGGGGTLEILAVDAADKEVQFKVTGHSYLALPDNVRNLTMIVEDSQTSGSAPSRRVPWGLLPNFTSAPNKGENVAVVYTSSFSVRGTGKALDIRLDWDDPNDPTPSHFVIPVGFDTMIGQSINSDSGDGTTLTLLEYVAPETLLTFEVNNRKYVDNGSSTIRMTALEINGGRGLVSLQPITITNRTPSLSVDPFPVIRAGAVAELFGSMSDPGSLDPLYLAISWGDSGAYEQFTFNPSTDPYDLYFTHQYPDEGDYLVDVLVFDNGGRSRRVQRGLTVNYNVPPVAYDDFIRTTSNAPVLINVLAHNPDPNVTPDPAEDPGGPDYDPDDGNGYGGDLVPGAQLTSTPAQGSLIAQNQPGVFLYDPGTIFANLLAGESAQVQFSYSIVDERGESATAVATIVIDGVSDPPELNFNEANVPTFVEDGPAVRLLTDVAVTDPDSSNFGGGSIVLQIDRNAEAADRLTLRSQGGISQSGAVVSIGNVPIGTISGGMGATPLVISLNASATPANAQTLLANVFYTNVSQAPSGLDRRVRIEVFDEANAVAPKFQSINVTPVNDAPVLTGRQRVRYKLKSDPVLLLAATSNVTDDARHFGGGVLNVSIVAGVTARDRLTIGSPFQVVTENGTSNVLFRGKQIGTINDRGGEGRRPLSISLNDDATVRITKLLMQSIQFSTTRGVGRRKIAFSLTDSDQATSNDLFAIVRVRS